MLGLLVPLVTVPWIGSVLSFTVIFITSPLIHCIPFCSLHARMKFLILYPLHPVFSTATATTSVFLHHNCHLYSLCLTMQVQPPNQTDTKSRGCKKSCTEKKHAKHVCIKDRKCSELPEKEFF